MKGDRGLVLGGCSGVDGSCSVHAGKCPRPDRDELLRLLARQDQRKLAVAIADDPTYQDRQ